MIKELSISGFRGFGSKESIKFALPNGSTPGSGLTIITGANNSGKTTIIESIKAFNGTESPSFSEGRRNKNANEIIELIIIDEKDVEYSIKSLGNSSSTIKNVPFNLKHYVLPSRRSIPFEFSKINWNKEQYISNAQKLENQRNSSLNSFDSRIFQIEKKKDEFDKILSKILGNDFQWTIEQRDSGSYYIKYIKNGISHSSEGVGDGIWSIFTICASLFDAEDNNVIVIDEPELSVHPALQKKLMNLLLECSMTKQIIICTHSPYFVNWEAITNGAQLIRIAKENTNSKCYTISDECRRKFKGILSDLNNPHTLGIEANEALFLEDKIILVEGQEDVVIIRRIAKELNIELLGDFFGWGVGGAPKMKAFLLLFKDLGYKHIVAILDGDKAKDAEKLRNEFSTSGYKIITLAEDDIRDKPSKILNEKIGVSKENGTLKETHIEYMVNLLNEINKNLQN